MSGRPSRTGGRWPRGSAGRARFDNQQFGQLVYRRLKVAVAAVVLVWGVLAGRTFFIQVVWADRLTEKARVQNEQVVAIPAPRGEICDRNGMALAVSWHNESFYTYPDTHNIALLAENLSLLFARPEEDLRRSLYNKREQFTWLVRQVDERTASRIRGWNIDDVYSMPEMTRAYTNGSTGRGVVGFVDTDNRGLAGIEYSCEKWLAGKEGTAVTWRDGLGRKYFIDPVRIVEPIPGCRVELTLDVGWQMVLQDELARGVEKYGARSGMAVLLDCRTGEVLAMADVFPDSNLSSDKVTKCRVVSDVFEPGSSFKLVTLATALSEGGLCPSDSFDAEMGKARFSKRYIHDEKEFGYLTLADAFRLSSNIVTGRIANLVGGETVRRWALRFGFGSRTGVMLPAEQRGSVPDHRWSEYVTAAFSIGHGVSVTTLQLANAYVSLANGGLLMKPYIVRLVTDARGGIVYQGKPTVLRRVMTPDVAARLLTMARSVVVDGTAKPVDDPDFPLAGKTGTAEKPDLNTGRMLKNKYIASFAGLWPADNPRLVGVVVLDEPQPIHYGGWTAAPILLNVFRRGSCANTHKTGQWPRLMASVAVVTETLVRSSPEEPVCAWIDSSDQGLSFWERRLVHAAGTDNFPEGIVPQVIGLTAREAVVILQNCGLDAAIKGRGRVIRQRPTAGSPCPPGLLCELALQ